MAEILEMPKLGLSMQEGTVVKWLFEEGSEVKKGQAVVEISTEKISNVVEASVDGVLLKVLVEEGETVPIKTPLGVIGKPGEEIDVAAETSSKENDTVEVEASEKEDVFEETEKEVVENNGNIPGVSPVAREYAKKAGIDPEKLAGSGPGGRVIKRDVKAYLQKNGLPLPVEGEYGNERVSPVADKLAQQAGIDPSVLQGSGYGNRVVKKDVERYLKENNISLAENIEKKDALASGVKVSPVAEKLAAEAGINVNKVTGTGPGGRIMKSDVERYLYSKKVVEGEQTIKELKTGKVKASQRRSLIAENMYESLQNTAQTTLTTDVNVTELIGLFQSVNEKLSEKLSLTAVFVKALAEVLPSYPEFNAFYNDGEIEYYSHINVGVAADVEEGLIVPVIREVERKRLTEISRELKELVARAKSNKLSLDELTGGTVTVSNLGMYDIRAFTPVLNRNESVLLGIGGIKEVPMVKNGGIFVGKEMILSLTIDHRLIDGAPAARFLQDLKKLLENPAELLLN